MIKQLLCTYLTWKFSLLRKKSFLWLPAIFTYLMTKINSFKQEILGRTWLALLLRHVSVFAYCDDGKSLGVITVQSPDPHSPTISTTTHYPHTKCSTHTTTMSQNQQFRNTLYSNYCVLALDVVLFRRYVLSLRLNVRTPFHTPQYWAACCSATLALT